MSSIVYALGRAAQELIPEIERYGIEVIMSEGRISWQNRVTIVKPYTPKAICKREIRKYIKLAKQLEEAEVLKNQTSLLKGDEL